jgi:hypothetical protein
VLSTVFWLLTMWAYAVHARRPRLRQYCSSRSFTLGLMSKPMVATLPVVLLLLDFWPLGRWPVDGTFWRTDAAFVEAPLVALAADRSRGPFAQTDIGAVSGFDVVPFALRFQNAVVSYVAYIGRIVWPPVSRRSIPIAWRCRRCQSRSPTGDRCDDRLGLAAARRAPYATVGWLWYVGTLVPVIGIVQVGRRDGRSIHMRSGRRAVHRADMGGAAMLARARFRARSHRLARSPWCWRARSSREPRQDIGETASRCGNATYHARQRARACESRRRSRARRSMTGDRRVPQALLHRITPRRTAICARPREDR